MQLADYYFADPRLVLIPIEQLTPAGLRPELATLLASRAQWDQRRIDLFNTAFTRYWTRTADLAARTRTWAPPRIRNVGIVADPMAVQPYVQLLNTSTWTLYAADFDPTCSDPELAAYLFVRGDRMSLTGEVTMAALHNAAYWFDRTDAECAAFSAAAARSARPDAVAFQALAAALPWLRRLWHDELRPAPRGIVGHAVPGTGLLVPQAMARQPPALVQQWTAVARHAVAAFRDAWRVPDRHGAAALCAWLAEDAPALLITGQRGRRLWDPDAPTRLGALRTELRAASGAGVRDIFADLQVIDAHTRTFLGTLTESAALPQPHPDTEQRGYCYLHRERRLLAYNLHEPELERLHAPAIPYARLMLGARAVHEWAHLAVDAGWVPQRASPARVAELNAAVAEMLDGVIVAAPRLIADRTAADVLTLRAAAPTPGAALVSVVTGRLPDYQANLLARRFLSDAEMETYVRQNIRTLRNDYTPGQLWRMLARYLAEYQYLALSAVTDPHAYFVTSTWFDADFFATGILDAARFDRLADTVAALCATYVVDERQFRSR